MKLLNRKHARIGVAVGAPLLAALAGTALLLQFHADTFTALDHSGYRLMAQAFREGRGVHEVDRVLAELPPDLRTAVTLLPNMEERNSRDRSFMITSLKDGTTEPFFYPLLPWLAAGLDRVVPEGLDLFVPLCGIAVYCGLLWTGVARGGMAGLVAALALWFVTPLPLWLYRGFYVESAGMACIAVGVLLWFARGALWTEVAACGLLGLAGAFHPVLFLPALPLCTGVVFGRRRPLGQTLAVCVAGVVGLVLIVWMTEDVCAPYGRIALGNLAYNFRVSASHRITTLFGGGFLLLGVALLATLRLWWRHAERLAGVRWVWVLALVAACVPLWAAAATWSQRAFVVAGARELWTAVRWPGAILAALGVTGLLWDQRLARVRFVLLVAILTAPVFLYLKGAEQMGLWSQRRLLPTVLLGIVVLLPGLVALVRLGSGWAVGRRRLDAAGTRVAECVCGLLVLALGFANAARWPAPYVSRVEVGAWEWVQDVKGRLGDATVLFDYYPYSVPFAVDNRTRALGLGERARERLPSLIDWLRNRSTGGAVRIATTYVPAALEDGLRLSSVSRERIEVERVRSKGALPAESYRREIAFDVLDIQVLTGARADLVQDKVLDGGPLGLRGHWGPQKKIGGQHEAMWTREGSAVVGPLPPTGMTVRVHVEGIFGGPEGREFQELRVHAPWMAAPVALAVSNEFHSAEAVAVRDPAWSGEGATCLYTLTSGSPYDPAADRIGGYPPDLGVRLHRIRLTVEPQGGE